MQVGVVQTMGWQFYGSFVVADNHNYRGCKINKEYNDTLLKVGVQL
jgi:hypothetical protein